MAEPLAGIVGIDATANVQALGIGGQCLAGSVIIALAKFDYVAT